MEQIKEDPPNEETNAPLSGDLSEQDEQAQETFGVKPNLDISAIEK
jgi:hypothetical protein